MSRKKRKKTWKNGCAFILNGERRIWLNPKFIFELIATNGLPVEAIIERLNEETPRVLTDWREVARLCVEHENLSKANSKFTKEIFASETTTEDTPT